MSGINEEYRKKADGKGKNVEQQLVEDFSSFHCKFDGSTQILHGHMGAKWKATLLADGKLRSIRVHPSLFHRQLVSNCGHIHVGIYCRLHSSSEHIQWNH